LSGFDDIRDAELARVARWRKGCEEAGRKVRLRRACDDLSTRVWLEGVDDAPLSEELAATLRSFARKLGSKTGAGLTTCKSAHRLVERLYEMIDQQ